MRNCKRTNTFKLTLFYLSFPLSIPEWICFFSLFLFPNGSSSFAKKNYESNLPIDLLNIPRNQAFRVMMTRHTANRIQLKFPKLSKFKHWIIALLTKCHMMNIYFVCNSLRLLNLNEIFFLSFFDGWKIRIKYKRNSLNTFFFSVSLEHLHFSQH